ARNVTGVQTCALPICNPLITGTVVDINMDSSTSPSWRGDTCTSEFGSSTPAENIPRGRCQYKASPAERVPEASSAEATVSPRDAFTCLPWMVTARFSCCSTTAYGGSSALSLDGDVTWHRRARFGAV